MTVRIKINTPLQPTKEVIAQDFSELKRRIERGDPVAIYEAILMCSGAKVEMPDWLADRLLKVIADYHLGRKPVWKRQGNRPLIVLRRRIETDVKRRAVFAVCDWQNDRSRYNEMPTKSIDEWFSQETKHKDCTTLDDAFHLAEIGLRGARIQKDGPKIKCSPSTIKRVYYKEDFSRVPRVPGRVATVFGLMNPDDLFGTTKTLPDGLL